MTAYPSVYFILVISESENDMYRSCIRSKFPIREKIELQFANHGLHESNMLRSNHAFYASNDRGGTETVLERLQTRGHFG